MSDTTETQQQQDNINDDESITNNTGEENVPTNTGAPLTSTNLSDEREQVRQQKKDHLSQQTQDTLERIASVVQGEMQLGFNELELLRKMNDNVAQRYEGMTERASVITTKISEMREQYAQLSPLLQQVDEIDANVSELSSIISALDKHTKQLETQLKPFL